MHCLGLKAQCAVFGGVLQPFVFPFAQSLSRQSSAKPASLRASEAPSPRAHLYHQEVHIFSASRLDATSMHSRE